MKTKNIVLFAIIVSLFGCSNNNVTVITHTSEITDSLTCSLDSVPTNGFPVHECVSDDGMMKFRSWNTGQGGTMPIYGVTCQYRTSDGTFKTIDLGKVDKAVAWVSRVHSIHKDDGTTYYILKRRHQTSSKDGYMWMNGFKIEDDTVKYVNVIDGSDIVEEKDDNDFSVNSEFTYWDDADEGEELDMLYEFDNIIDGSDIVEEKDDNDFSVNFEITHWDDVTNGERWDSLFFEYDTETKDLYVPLTEPMDNSPYHINDRYRVFHFNGKKFVDKGVTCNKGLNRSLADYVTLLSYFRTKNYIVRIDSLASGNYRYASWKATSTMKDRPEIVIVGNKHDQETDSYTFVNSGVEYIAGHKEKERNPEGSFYLRDFLLVRKNGKVIMKEEKRRIDN